MAAAILLLAVLNVWAHLFDLVLMRTDGSTTSRPKCMSVLSVTSAVLLPIIWAMNSICEDLWQTCGLEDPYPGVEAIC